jgi:DNA-binding transcriptional ArsR family regulator
MFDGPQAVRKIADVGTLRVLSDPLRLAILRTLMEVPDRVMSVKELAGALGEPQTRLYRHVKQLEAHDLIRVAQTRVVSGITEQQYQAGQLDLQLDRALLASAEGRDTVATSMLSTLDHVREHLASEIQTGRIRFAPGSGDESAPVPAGGLLVARLTPEQYTRVREMLQQVRDHVRQLEDADDEDAHRTVSVNLLTLLYAAADDG